MNQALLRRIVVWPVVGTLLLLLAAEARLQAADGTIEYKGADGPGKGKRIVLVSGDEEYRSEEALPQLAKILATEHGFDCTVCFAINPQSGYIDPNYRQGIAGLAALNNADLMVLFTRRRDLPDDQMQIIDNYLKAGKPLVGIRTATHAFLPPRESKWAYYADTFDGEPQEWHGGFGRLVLGETWVNHHGEHKQESTRGIIAPNAANHPILRGIKDGEIWGSTDVYEVRLPLPGDSQPLVLGQVTTRKGAFDPNDRFYGMRPDDGPPVAGAKNEPMMPIAWAKTYQIPGGKPGRAFASTIGASVDLLNEATRRMLVNAVYWCIGCEDKIPPTGTRVDLVGTYDPTKFEFRKDDYWASRKMAVDEFRLDDPAKK
ncbi:MAG: ThuA domain-containing protein [Pirellulales bacterium]